jgi:hypothetical protein
MSKMMQHLWKHSRFRALFLGLAVWFPGAAALWYWLPFQPRFTLPNTEDSIVAGFSPDGRILATKRNTMHWTTLGKKKHDENGPIRLWNLDTGEEIGSYSTDGRFADHIEFSLDGRIMVICSLSSDPSEGNVTVIDTKVGRELANIHVGPYFSVTQLTADGRTLVLNPAAPKGAKIWDIPAGRERLISSSWPVYFSPNGQWFVSMESAYELWVRISATEISTLRIKSKGYPLSGLTISPDGTMLACGGDEGIYGAVKIWDPITAQELACLEGASNPKFSRSGKRLAACCPQLGGATFKVWETTHWEELAQTQLPSPISNSPAILAGPNLDDLRAVSIENRGTAPGTVEQWMAANLGLKSLGKAKMFHDLRVFDIASGKELLSYATEGDIHVAPDARTFVVDFGTSPWPTKDTRECIGVFDIPCRRPILQIVLWPLTVSLLAVMIYWLLARGKRPAAS